MRLSLCPASCWRCVLVHSALGQHRDVRVPHVMDVAQLDAGLVEDAVPRPARCDR
jgi:hypothetical protein